MWRTGLDVILYPAGGFCVFLKLQLLYDSMKHPFTGSMSILRDNVFAVTTCCLR
jgi:hypothetical protein